MMSSPRTVRFCLLCCVSLWLAVPIVSPLPAADEDLLRRIDQLEAETRALREQMAGMAAAPSRLPAVDQPPAPDGDTGYFTRDELRKELSALAWRKGEYTVTPYGFVSASGIFETERSYPGDIILWVLPADLQGESASYFDAKSSRLGLDVTGPSFRDMKMNARFEFDFQGQYVYRNKPGVLFRQAYVQAADDDQRILFGQTWDVISPLYPGTLNYVPGSAYGSLGYRRAQLQYSRFLHFSDTFMVTVQGSANVGVINDFVSDPFIYPQTSGWPELQGRVAFTLGEYRCPDAMPIIFGISGHIGEEQFDVLEGDGLGPLDDVGRQTWSFNLDLTMPINERLKLTGELFMGSNLASYMGGILQGIDRTRFNAVRSRGGWIDLEWHWSEPIYSHVGYSYDDPINSDLTSGRIYNGAYYVNFLHDFSPLCTLGFEVSGWRTHWIDHEPGDSVRFELQLKYRF